MPIYEYACGKCESEFEVEQRITDDPIKSCPHCKSRKIKRLISRTSFVLKGGGWYSDLYASSGAKDQDDKPGKSDSSDDKGKIDASDSKSETKGEAKSEPKSESKSADTPKAKGKAAGKAKGKSKSSKSVA